MRTNLSLIPVLLVLLQQPVSTPAPAGPERAGSVEPSRQDGTLPGLPGVKEPRSVARPVEGTPSASPVDLRPVGPPYDIAGLVVGYEAGRSISIRESNGTVRTVALPSTLVVPPDLSYGKYATVTLQRVKRGLPKVLSVSMGEALRPPLDPAPEPRGRARGPAAPGA